MEKEIKKILKIGAATLALSSTPTKKSETSPELMSPGIVARSPQTETSDSLDEIALMNKIDVEQLKKKIIKYKYPRLDHTEPIDAPRGYTEMCEWAVDVCDQFAETIQPPVELSPKIFGLIDGVNSEVNLEKRPVSDVELFGQSELWYPYEFPWGDCEDYALIKFFRLAQRGFPKQAMSFVMVNDENGNAHLVLGIHVLVNKKKITLILDNRKSTITLFPELGYTFRRISKINSSGLKWFGPPEIDPHERINEWDAKIGPDK